MNVVTLLDHRSENVRAAASALLNDEDAWHGLMDALEEGGEMPLFEVGKCYLVKTHALYYLGRVKAVSFEGVILEQVSEVYDTGPMNLFFAGTIKQFESYPKGVTCPIPIGSIQAAPSYPEKHLPGGGK